ncbi:Retrovirus-related Pol polyprotein from transposon 17.6, partial [Mucuna pruriens]
MIKNRYLLSRIDDLMDLLVEPCVFSKIDLRLSYHHIHVKSKDVLRTTFRAHYSHYKYLVMIFCVTNGLGVFMDYMNRIFHPYLDNFVVVFIDDILVYFNSGEEHAKHLRVALQVFKDKQLDAKMSKSLEWETPKSMSKIRSFLGLVKYYKRFIEGFSKLALPLTRLIRKGQVFVWDFKCESSFLELKQWLTSCFLTSSEPFVVYCDASRMGLKKVLMQEGKRHYLYIARFEVFSDHKGLKHLFD